MLSRRKSSVADAKNVSVTSDGALSAAYPVASAAWQRAQYLVQSAAASIGGSAVGAALGILCALALRQHMPGVERWLEARVAPGPAMR
jgi:hypothetical protein